MFSGKFSILERNTFLIVFIVLVALSGCSVEKRIKEMDEFSGYEKNSKSDYVLEDVTHYHYEDGILKVLIKFKIGNYYKKDDKLEMIDCNFTYFNKSGDVASKGSADKALLYSLSSKLIAIGNVVITSEINGVILHTEMLEWDGIEEKFFTDREVEIRSKEGNIITGRGMEGDIALRFIKIKYNVRGKLVGKGL